MHWNGQGAVKRGDAMTWKRVLWKIIARIRGANSFYAKLPTRKIPIYQFYFERILEAIDIDNCSKVPRGENYSIETLPKDDHKIELIANKAIC